MNIDMNLLRKVLFAGVALCAASALVQSCGDPGQKAVSLSDVSVLKSPDGNLSMKFGIAPDGSPMYSLNYGETAVIRPSHLGYEMRGVLKAQKIVFGDKDIRKVDDKPCWSFHDGFKVERIDTCTLDRKSVV